MDSGFVKNFPYDVMLDLPQRQVLPTSAKFDPGPDTGYLENAVLRKEQSDQTSADYGVSFDNGLNGKCVIDIDPEGQPLLPCPLIQSIRFYFRQSLEIFVKNRRLCKNALVIHPAADDIFFNSRSNFLWE